MRQYEFYFETKSDKWDPKEVREKLWEAWVEPDGLVFDRHRELIQRLGLLMGKPNKTDDEIYIGDRQKIQEAIDSTPCPGQIMRYFDPEGGLFRNGVDQPPEGAVAAFYDGSDHSQFVVKEAE